MAPTIAARLVGHGHILIESKQSWYSKLFVFCKDIISIKDKEASER
jgi:ribosomal protein S4